MPRFYITTAIPYVNAKPHIGHALEFVQADVIARTLREQYGIENVRFLTGTDDNAIKNVQAAEKAGIPVKQFVDENAQAFLKLAEALNISNDDFIRTTEQRHHTGARKLWGACAASGDVYEKEYEGLYCVGCETFYLEKDLEGGLCPEHKTKPEPVREKNWFFNLKKYEPFLKDAYANNRIRIHPKSRGKETTNFIAQGLEDFSISRSNERAKNWGVNIPGDPAQKMYVWFDALANYITALGYADDSALFRDFWVDGSITHVIGKGITKFHAIYWPAMLASAGIFPKNGLDIFVHGYVTVNGEKISKSLGNAVDPFTLIETYGVDAVRYFLLREIPATEDGDFSYEKFKQRYNSDLANGVGNLVQRVITLAEKLQVVDIDRRDLDNSFINPNIPVGNPMGLLYFSHKILEAIWEEIRKANEYIDRQKPWEKTTEQIKIVSSLVWHILQIIAPRLKPYLPETTSSIFKIFGSKELSMLSPTTSLSLVPKKGGSLFKRIL